MIEKLQIDYSLIGKAVEWYQSCGYQPINVNWMVPPMFSLATWSNEGDQFKTIDHQGFSKHLVGSAEQGFIEQAALGNIEYGKRYVSVSPCFRRGDNKHPTNMEWFMKVELSVMTKRDDTLTYADLAVDARECFEKLGAEPVRLSYFYDTERSLDIVHSFNHPDCPGMNYIELGSYGYRELSFPKGQPLLQNDEFVVHYGTGLALPRFQLIL